MVSGADSRIGEEDPSNGVVKYDENTPEEIADDAEVVYQELSPREKAILEETRALRLHGYAVHSYHLRRPHTSQARC